MTHIAAYEAYDAVEIRLPNRPILRCRALTMRWAMRFFRYMEHGRQGDAFATELVFRELPRAVTPRRWGFLPLSREHRRARRVLSRLRGAEAVKVLTLLFPDPPVLIEPTKTADTDQQSTTTIDDMIAEYAMMCGGPPPGELPYPLFVAIVGRHARFEARALLNQMTATSWGSGMIKDSPDTMTQRETMRRLAYGGKKRPRVFALKQSPDG